jgi:DNA repair protein RadC
MNSKISLLSDGHRARLRDRFSKTGLAGFAQYEVLELLLTLCIPRKDVKGQAKELILRFGSIKGVMDAPIEALQMVAGMGTVAPVALKIIREAASLYLQQDAEFAPEVFNSMHKFVEFWRMRLGDLKYEVFEVAYLDRGRRLLSDGVERLQEGDIDRVAVYPRRLMAAALKRSASAIIIAHNHPSGRVEPSTADVVLTNQLMKVSKCMGIELIDHIIIGDGEAHFSFRLERMLENE